MRNIFVLPTDKPSSGYILGKCIKELSDVKIGQLVRTHYMMFSNEYFQPQNIYITNTEEIKDSEIDTKVCIFKSDNGMITCLSGKGYGRVKTIGKYYEIILTDNEDLIKDGIPEISEDFLQWFVKNSDCERVEIRKIGEEWIYNPDVPKEEPKPLPDVNWQSEIINKVWDEEEPKQETLEELAKNTTKKYVNEREKQTAYLEFISGYQLAQEHAKKMFSEESMFDFARFCSDNHSLDDSDKDNICWTPIFKESVKLTTKEMFEKFKNKK
jgi:hypothetical protein